LFFKIPPIKINLRGYPLWMDSPFDNVRDYLEALEVAITFCFITQIPPPKESRLQYFTLVKFV